MKKLLALILSLLIAVSLFGCAEKTDDATTTGDSNPENTATPAAGTSSPEVKTTASTDDVKENQLPIVSEPLTLTYFHYLDGKVSATMASNEEIRCYQEMEKLTGIDIEWIHPPAGQEAEKLNLMIASYDLPDLIYTGWNGVPGGPHAMIDNEVIIPLNEYIDQLAPDYSKIINDESNPDLYRQARLDDGTIYMFAQISSEGHRINQSSLQYRQDWLDALGIENVPATIDDWEEVYKLVKETDLNGNGEKDELPFCSYGTPNQWSYSFGVNAGTWSMDGDTVYYGPTSDAAREYLTYMNRWYTEGLLDKEYIVTDGDALNTKITGERGFSYWGILSANLGTYQSAFNKTNPEAKLAGAPYPKADDGYQYRPVASYIGGSGTAITTACKHVEEAAKWLNFAYTEQGHNLIIFGVEGESYEWVDGYPKFKDVVTNNPDGLTFAQALSRFSCGSFSGAYVKDQRQFEQAVLTYDEQRQAFEAMQSGNVSDAIFLPPITRTKEESERYNEIMGEVDTYVKEMFDKFIMGSISLDEFDSFKAKVENLGIEEARQLTQDAVDRYLGK